MAVMYRSPHKKDARRKVVKFVSDQLWPKSTDGNKSMPKRGSHVLFYNNHHADYAGHQPATEPLPICTVGHGKKMCKHRRAKQKRKLRQVALKNFWPVKGAPGTPMGKHMDAKGVVCGCGKCKNASERA